jgi:hypothetical protein
MDKHKEDFYMLYVVNKFPVEEIQVILLLDVLYHLYKVLNDLIEDQDNNQRYHSDEFD